MPGHHRSSSSTVQSNGHRTGGSSQRTIRPSPSDHDDDDQSSNHENDTEEIELEEVRSARKRELEELIGDCSRKKPKLESTALADILHQARWIPRGIHPWVLFEHFLHSFDHMEDSDEDVERDDDDNELDDEQRLRNEINKIHCSDIIATVGGLASVLKDLKDHGVSRRPLIAAISDAAHNGRSDDSGRLKGDVLRYTLPTPLDVHVPRPALDNPSSKEARGYQDPVFAKLICPMDLYHKYRGLGDALWERITNGDFPEYDTANSYPLFMYEDPEEYDPKKFHKGLFRGYLLLRVARHIFTGPSSALRTADGEGSRKRKGVAARHSIKFVTPQMIAYAAIQTRFSISTMKDWDDKDGNFDVSDFFDGIVDMLQSNMSVKDTKYRKSLLAWWNKKLFGIGPKCAQQSQDGGIAAMNPLARLAAQRAQGGADDSDEEDRSDREPEAGPSTRTPRA